MSTIAAILAPVFLVVLLGWVLARSEFLSAQTLAELNRLTYWLGLPALLIVKLAAAEPDVGGVLNLLFVLVGATLLGMLLAALVSRRMGLPVAGQGSFTQGGFRGNLAFIGLPVVVYAFQSDAAVVGDTLLVLGPLMVLYNVLAVLVLLPSGDHHRGVTPWRILRTLLTNPILIACLIGLALSLSALALPAIVERTLSALGQMALPLALICIGGGLAHTTLRGSVLHATTAAVIKVAAIPLIGGLLGLAVGLATHELRVALILLASPTAVASYVLARQMGADATLASGIILMSTLLALPALAVVLAVTAG
ncbi:MAG: AEC family transporter [Chromatiales bacterium]|nr:AEC family transporter [Chromatiales bacterium]